MRLAETVTPDLPVEEASECKAVANKYDVDATFLAAPSTSNERFRRIIEYSPGFLYLMSFSELLALGKSLGRRALSS